MAVSAGCQFPIPGGTAVLCKVPSLSPSLFFRLEFCIKRRTETRASARPARAAPSLRLDVAEAASAELISTPPNGSGMMTGDFDASEHVGHVSHGKMGVGLTFSVLFLFYAIGFHCSDAIILCFM